MITSNITTPVLDFFKMTFVKIAIEMEFIGKMKIKDENEKGLIIKIDEVRAEEVGLNLDSLKSGQTVVKVIPLYFKPTKVYYC